MLGFIGYNEDNNTNNVLFLFNTQVWRFTNSFINFEDKQYLVDNVSCHINHIYNTVCGDVKQLVNDSMT